MATPDPELNSNMWYVLYVGGPEQSLIGTDPYASSYSRGAVYFDFTNESRPNNRWQVFRLNSTTYTLRCSIGGPNSWLMASDTDEATSGKTRPMIARGDIADASAYWSISPWGDGTWFMTNAANGTGYHLNREDGNGTLSIDPNITAPQNGQRWGFKEITEINDSRFSTVNLLGAVIATSSAPGSSVTSSSSSISTTSTSSAPTTSTQTNPSSSSGGLSPAVQGAIGGAIGGVALIAFIVLGLFFWRRRKQRQFRPSHEVHEVHEAPSQSVKYTMYHESPVREIPVEAPGMTRDPAELPANTVGR